VGCLYCGKEIGLVRQMRDREFCSAAHRKNYGARLGKALEDLATPEPPPAPVADFRINMPLQAGHIGQSIAVFEFGHGRAQIGMSSACPVSIAGVRGQSAITLAGSHWAPFAAELCSISQADRLASLPALEFPRFELLADELMAPESDEFDEGPPLAGAFWNIPQVSEVAHTKLTPDLARKSAPIVEPAPMSMVAAPLVIGIRGTVKSPAAEVVEAFLPPAPYSAHVAFQAAAVATQAFTLQPVSEFEEEAPEMTGPVAAPAPEAVEAFLPVAPFAEAMAFTRKVALASAWNLQLSNDVAMVLASSGPVAAPAAEVVEAFLPPAPYSTEVAFPAIAAMLNAWVPEPISEVSLVLEACGPVAAPAAEPVEALLPETPYAAQMAFPAMAAMLNAWVPEPISEISIACDPAGVVAAPAAEAVEALLPVAPYAAQMNFPAMAAMLSAWVPEPIAEFSLVCDPAGAVAAPAAEAAETFLPVAPYAAAVAFPAAATAAMTNAWTLQPVVEVSFALPVAGAVQAPAPEAAETLFPATPMAQAVAYAASAVQLPQLTLAAVEPTETLNSENVADFVDVVPASEEWMATPPACEVEREVVPVVAAALRLEAAVQAPHVAALSIAEPIVRESAGWRRFPIAEPVVAFVSSRLAESISEAALQSATFHLPDLAGLGVAGTRQSAPVAPAAEQKSPNAAEPQPAAAVTAAPAAAKLAGVIRFPSLALAQTTGSPTAAFRSTEAGVAAPETAVPDGRTARMEPLSTIAIVSPTAGTNQPGAAFPQGQLVPMEYYCQRSPMPPRINLDWQTRKSAAMLPRFAMRTAFDRLEDLAVLPMTQERETPSFTEIFSIADAARRAQHSRLRAPARAVAAALLMGVGLWFGAGSAKLGRQLLSANTDWPSAGSSSSAGSQSSGALARVRSVFVPPAPAASEGPIEKVRRAIRSRAAAELSDTFRGMEAWGGAAAALPAGWSHNAAGYVKTGALALYHPSLGFTDYRMEFFGQIENKGMGWAVRASNEQNYYGMKFKVIEPGMRQTLAAVHYPVVDGKRGEGIETPLSVMIHNRTPYHVAVEVKGNKVTTSIEGEEVDSWTDDRLKVGGVGFFSDAGESAHLYWMKITKNQDWLGRVCAYLSGNSSSTVTGDLWRDDFGPSPAPRPMPRPSPDAILATVETEDFPFHGSHRAKILTNGRTELCSKS
jgi:hypothetical protein